MTRVSRRSVLLGLWFSLWSVAALPRSVQAQHPLCPAPSAEDTYYVACQPGTTEAVAKFLYDVSLRHLFKGEATFEIDTERFLNVVGLGRILDPTNPDVGAFLKDRSSIVFTPLDRTTGEFMSKGAGEPRKLSVKNEQTGIALELNLPETVQGLYWRSPSHLELQFYKGHGIRFHLSGSAAAEYEEGLQCVSLSQTRVRVTTGDPTHRYLMGMFDQCQ